MENNKLNKLKLIFNENKRGFLVGIVGLVVIAIALFMVINKKRDQVVILVEGCQEGDLFSGTTGKPCFNMEFEACKEGDLYNINTGEPCAKTEAKDTKSSKGSLGYEAALKEYTGRSFIFDENCVSATQTVASKVGSAVLVANNSKKTLEFNVQNKKTILTPYHYVLSFMSTVGEVDVMCEGNNVAKVVVN